MNDKPGITPGKYESLLSDISDTYNQGRQRAIQAVNTNMVETYWNIGRYIVEFEQGSSVRATYGAALLENLSSDLSRMHGRGFSRSNLNYMRLAYLRYPICETISHKLNWSQICELVKIDDPLERSFYENQTILEKWNVRELKRQKNASLFLRLAASQDKEGILKLARQGQLVEKADDIIKEPYVFEFLKIPEPYQLSENELESRLIDNLEKFLLELGKGFAFIGRQYRITLANTHYFIDLVFYHRILKCFVLIDLKREKAGYEDVGQMNMYLGYFENEENSEGDNPPIGIVLAREKDEILIKYAMHNISSQLFVKKYKLYLPDKEELRREIEKRLIKDDE